MSKRMSKDNKKTEKEEVIEAPRPSRKRKIAVVSFDAYFQSLVKEKKSIQKHHKAPMRKYAESKGVLEATKEEFDRLFRLY